MAAESQELAPVPTFETLSRLLVASGGPEASIQAHAPDGNGRWPGALRLVFIVGSALAVWAAMFSMVR